MQVTTGARIPSELSVRQRGSGLIWLFPRAAESRARHSNAQHREHSSQPPHPLSPCAQGPAGCLCPSLTLPGPCSTRERLPGSCPAARRGAGTAGQGQAGPPRLKRGALTGPGGAAPHRAPGSRGAGSCSLRPGPAPAPLCPAAAAAPPRSGPGPPRAPPAPRARPQRPRPGREAAPAPAPLTWARAAGPART